MYIWLPLYTALILYGFINFRFTRFLNENNNKKIRIKKNKHALFAIKKIKEKSPKRMLITEFLAIYFVVLFQLSHSLIMLTNKRFLNKGN